jgi:hypothetical protein
MSDDNDYGLNLVQLATHAFQLEANLASVMPI